MTDEETVEVDGDHPWVQAAAIMTPGPMPTHIGVFPSEIQLPQEDGTVKTADAAMLTIVTPAGVTSVYLPPQALVALFQQTQGVLEFWQHQAAVSPKLMVATPDMMKAATNHADSLQEAAKRFRDL